MSINDLFINEMLESDNVLDVLNKQEFDSYKQELWNVLKNNQNDSMLKNMLEIIGENKYNEIIKFLKEENSDFFAFSYFRNTKKDSKLLKIELSDIYEKVIVINRFKTIKEEYSKIPTNDFIEIINTLQSITDFCIENNFPGSKMIDVLESVYNISREISADLENIFDVNKLSLKLDFIISRIKKN